MACISRCCGVELRLRDSWGAKNTSKLELTGTGDTSTGGGGGGGGTSEGSELRSTTTWSLTRGASGWHAELQTDPTSHIDWSKIALLDHIGAGANGDVYRATYAGTEVAVKLLRKRQLTSRERRLLIDECRLMLQLRHPHVLSMIGFTSDLVMNHGMVMELMLTSLQQLIDSEVDVLTWATPLLQLAADTAKGMAYLHDRQILHRDLKPDNVLLSGFRDADGRHSGLRAKVADFGESRVLADANASAMTMTVAGTPSFMAPEVLRQERYGSEADVWSFGGMLVQMATRKPPYQALLDESAGLPVYVIMQRVAQGELRPTHGVAENTEWPPEVERIATACVAADRDERPNFQTIVRELDALSRAHTTVSTASRATPSARPTDGGAPPTPPKSATGGRSSGGRDRRKLSLVASLRRGISALAGSRRAGSCEASGQGTAPPAVAASASASGGSYRVELELGAPPPAPRPSAGPPSLRAVEEV